MTYLTMADGPEDRFPVTEFRYVKSDRETQRNDLAIERSRIKAGDYLTVCRTDSTVPEGILGHGRVTAVRARGGRVVKLFYKNEHGIACTVGIPPIAGLCVVVDRAEGGTTSFVGHVVTGAREDDWQAERDLMAREEQLSRDVPDDMSGWYTGLIPVGMSELAKSRYKDWLNARADYASLTDPAKRAKAYDRMVAAVTPDCPPTASDIARQAERAEGERMARDWQKARRIAYPATGLAFTLGSVILATGIVRSDVVALVFGPLLLVMFALALCAVIGSASNARKYLTQAKRMR